MAHDAIALPLLPPLSFTSPPTAPAAPPPSAGSPPRPPPHGLSGTERDEEAEGHIEAAERCEAGSPIGNVSIHSPLGMIDPSRAGSPYRRHVPAPRTEQVRSSGPEAERRLWPLQRRPTGVCGRGPGLTRATTARARVSGESTPASDEYLPRHALGGPACRLSPTVPEHLFLSTPSPIASSWPPAPGAEDARLNPTKTG